MHLVSRVFGCARILSDPPTSTPAVSEKIGVAQVQGIGDLPVEVWQVEI